MVGAKIRLAGPNARGRIWIYSFLSLVSGQCRRLLRLQSDAAWRQPGSTLGDFGLIGFFDGRLSQHVNVSANGGYILNSNPKSEADE